MSTSDQLQQAFRLIKDGNKTQATAILVPIVRAEPNNADAWWLLANAVSSPDQQRRSLEQVLRLRPNDEKARRMLDRIGGGSTMPPQQDPFAGTPSYPPQQQSYDPFAAAPPPQQDPFASSDPFAHVSSGQPVSYAQPVQYAQPVVVQRRRSGCSTCLIILVVLALVSCTLCTVVAFALPAVIPGLVGPALEQALTAQPEIGVALNEAIGTMSTDPNLAPFAATLSSMIGNTGISPRGTASPSQSSQNLGSQLTGTYNQRGTVERGQNVTGTVDTFEDDGWTLSGGSGDRLTIDLRATDNQLDPQLYVYAPDGSLIAENDDIDFANNNRDSRVSVTLPAAGTYTIIVSAFGQGGDYELSVR